MREFRHFGDRGAGAASPLLGPCAPVAFGLLTLLSACSGTEREESLPILQVGMTDTMESIYDDGELELYEVKKGIAFPILAPDSVTRDQLNDKGTEPYGSYPWVTTDNIDVQVNFTISNLDDEPHLVQMLVDPWNEFGRYYPGLQLTDADNEEYMPNFSAIDRRYIVPGKGEGQASRIHGTYTFAELEETAKDLATVMGLLAAPPPVEDEEEDLTVTYANHAFYVQNRSYDDPLVAEWLPQVIAGLTGLDIGFRTYEKANVAIEVAVELVDKNGDRVRREGESKPLLEPTEEIITVGVAPP